MTDRPGTQSPTQVVDPRTAEEQPPFPKQEQPLPGLDAELTPRADHGEESYIGNGRLAGMAALITGADSGIGRAVALAFAREGADVVVSYLEETVDANETVRLVEEEGRRAIDAPGDISDPEFCRQLVDRTVEEFGRIDLLVNNAAHQRMVESIEEITTEDWDHTMATNITAMFHLCKAAIPKMDAGASIINVSSVQAYQPSPQLLAYATTKGAIVTFSKALAQMVAEQGIRVNVVAPGPVWTPLIAATADAESVSTFGQQSALGRPAQPAELAPVFVLLASPEASYITGSVYGVTGGQPVP
jgi:NAD(P)-dependent dehydrogenase (short-subunit alcohol dehydrogenase family)